MDNLFPVDIFAVKQYGVAKWQADFFWPVSDKDFVAMCGNLEECVRRHIEQDSQDIGDALMVKRNIISECWHFLHAVKVLDEIKKRGLQPIYSDAALWYKDILENTFHDKVNGISGKRTRIYHTQGRVFQRWKRRLKLIIKETFFNSVPRKIWSRIKGNEVYLYGVPDEFIAAYCKRLPQWVKLTSFNDWLLKSLPELPNNLQEELRCVAVQLIGDVREVAVKYQIPLSMDHLAYLQGFIEGQIFEAAQIIRAVRQVIHGRHIHLLASTLHDQFQRVLALEVRKVGGKVTSFTHGGHIGYLNSPTIPFNEFALSDTFVAYTKKSAELFEVIKRERPIVRNNAVRIEWSDGTMYRDMWKRWRHASIPQQIKKVMLIGFPLTPWRKPQGSASLALMQLDFELRIVDILKQTGYRVIYKAHPDRLKEMEGIFEEKTTVLTEQFEKVMDQADAFLFSNIRTTAFNIALCTNKPVIGFMGYDEYPSPFLGPMELLKKRCHLLYTYFDGRNRIMFEGNDLLEALAKIPKMPDMEFMKTYLF